MNTPTLSLSSPGILHLGELYRQCAAVTTQSGLTRAPPHSCSIPGVPEYSIKTWWCVGVCVCTRTCMRMCCCIAVMFFKSVPHLPRVLLHATHHLSPHHTLLPCSSLACSCHPTYVPLSHHPHPHTGNLHTCDTVSSTGEPASIRKLDSVDLQRAVRQLRVMLQPMICGELGLWRKGKRGNRNGRKGGGELRQSGENDVRICLYTGLVPVKPCH